MKVALYHPWLKSRGGIEQFITQYADRSEHDITIYTLFYDEAETFDAFENLEVQVLGSNEPPKGLFDKARRFGWGSVTRKLPTDEHDALIVSEAGLGSLITLRNHDIPTLCYCHTPLRAAHPDFRRTYARELPWWQRPLLRGMVWGYSVLERLAWRTFDAVVCNSETTRDRVARKGLAAREEMQVVHPGADVDTFTPQDSERYFLYPSRFRRYKRQDLAIRAFNRVKDELPEFRLVLAGAAQEPDYIDALQAMDTERVEFRFDVDADDWRELYERAYAVLFMAEQEDWGIVPIEGMAAGKPVLAVDEGGPTESIIDGETGRLVRDDPASIARVMQEWAGDQALVDELGAAGREHAQQYSWTAFAETLDREVRNL